MSDERFNELESKVSFQEETIKELSTVIYQQQKQIDRLQNIFASITDRLNSLTEPQSSDFLSNDKPPHY